MSRKALWLAIGAATLFLLFHLPYLAKSLEDVDSINFALGVRDFDVAHHQPHPPGYPVYIALGKALHALGASEVRALSLLGVIAGSAGVLAFLAFFSALDAHATGRAPAATAVAVSAPLYWLTASRPLTDVVGLTAAVAVQALIVNGESDRAIVAASFLAAFAAGIRSQVAWLTVPLLVFAIAQRRRRSLIAPSLAAFVVGGCAWGIPLLLFTGGMSGYWRALANQGNEDLTNIVMLWTTHTVREVEMAIYYAFVAPWGSSVLAGAVLVLAALGVVTALRRPSRASATLVVAFVPYLLFDLVFQETFTARYALPLVAPVAYLAAAGAETLGSAGAVAAVVVIAMFGMHLGGTSVAAYASGPAPAFRLLDAMQTESSARPETAGAGRGPVLAMHRREDFDLRRPIAWAGLPPIAQRLAAPPKHEWLELVKYWNGGGRDTVWFVADPLRSDLALIGLRESPEQFRYTLDYPVLLGGTRPFEMDWHVIPPPDWYVAEGWSLTPEAAGVAREDHRGPGYAPVDGWVRRWPGAGTIVVGGRNLAAGGPPAHVRVLLDGRVVDEVDVPRGFFLRAIDVPAGGLNGEGGYAHIAISATSPDVAIEQFDAQPADRIVIGYGEGWHEREYNPGTGRIWRWTSDHGVLQVRTPQQALALTMEGEVEAASKSRVTIRAGDRIVAAQDIGAAFSIRQVIPREFVREGENTITVSTDQTYVPAERRSRTQDRRLLGLKVFSLRVTPAS